jgi:hypothetical protein
VNYDSFETDSRLCRAWQDECKSSVFPSISPECGKKISNSGCCGIVSPFGGFVSLRSRSIWPHLGRGAAHPQKTVVFVPRYKSIQGPLETLGIATISTECISNSTSKSEFGQVISGHIILSGVVKSTSAIVSQESRQSLDVKVPGNALTGSEWRGIIHDPKLGTITGLVSFDHEIQDSKAFKVQFLAIDARAKEGSSQHALFDCRVFGLVLVRTDQFSDTYRRIELASLVEHELVQETGKLYEQGLC